MSAREELIARTRKHLWDAWQTSNEDMGSEAGATLLGLGMLVPEGGAAELERLRLLQNVQPAELSEAQTDALADAGNRALNDHYHEDLCHCSDWPESCASSGNYFAGSWDTAAFTIGMAAVIGAWESMRAPTEADELSRLGAELDEAQRAYTFDTAALRARVAELEALTPASIQTCRFCGAGYDYGQPCSVCEFKARMASETAGREAEPDAPVTGTLARREALMTRAAAFLTGSREEPHDSPLHHTYRLGHDLPEAPHA